MNLHAIAIQVKHWLQQDVPRVLPLHGISSVLQSSSGLSLFSAQDLDELNEAVHRLSEQLQQVKIHQRTSSIMLVLPLRPNMSSTPGLVTQLTLPPMPISNPKVPVRKHLLPPSPETKQKRKKSMVFVLDRHLPPSCKQ